MSTRDLTTAPQASPGDLAGFKVSPVDCSCPQKPYGNLLRPLAIPLRQTRANHETLVHKDALDAHSPNLGLAKTPRSKKPPPQGLGGGGVWEGFEKVFVWVFFGGGWWRAYKFRGWGYPVFDQD
jgi:hypothetical protein